MRSRKHPSPRSQRAFTLTASLLGGFWCGASATPAHAEGSAQLGINGRVQADTELLLDVLRPDVERIAWRGVGTLTVVAPDGVTPVAVLASGERTGDLSAFGAGAYQLTLSDGQGPNGLPADWDVAIVDQDGLNLPTNGGRLYATQWNITTGNRTAERALDTSFFALVPGGAPDTDAGRRRWLEVDGLDLHAPVCARLHDLPLSANMRETPRCEEIRLRG